jgi:hypothetical protein
MNALATSIGNGDVLLWMLELFAFVIWFWLLLTIFGDLFRDHKMSGGMKAVWIVVLVLLPYVGILVYLLARGNGMASRAAAQSALAQQQLDERTRTATPATPAAQITQANTLLQAGAIDQHEFDRLKAVALAT